jgi:HD-GYP domain-containing protein (c-di-GMP phosphodiesterase class II)
VGADEGGGVRLAELVAALSLAVDLGLGQPMEHLLRACLVALRLAEDVGLGEEGRAVVYYVALLGWVGCHADAHEQAAWFGDDIALKADRFEVDFAGVARARFMWGHLGGGASPARRTQLLGSLVASRARLASMFEATHCRIAGNVAVGLGLGAEVAQALQYVFERWDGKGSPAGVSGENIPVAARIVPLASVAEFHRRQGGVDGVVGAVRRWRGTHFDPGLVDCLCANVSRLMVGLDSAASWEEVIAGEPALRPVLASAELDRALEAVSELADLKSPYMTGHSRAVAELACEAARRSGLSDASARALRRAALIHDLGRLGVSSAIWDKRGSLSAAEMERVRMHPYYTLRMFSRQHRLRYVAELGASHSERVDGSGYPRGLSGAALGLEGRLLAAADVYQALIEPRPHRPPHDPEQARRELESEVRGGRLDGEAVSAVLGAAGHRVGRRRDWPAGLTSREVEVLGLLVHGASNREIGSRLWISPKTVGNHIEHIYAKIGVSSRAEASLFAMQHGLLGELDPTQR